MRKRNVSNNVTMSVRKNNPTERAIKMSERVIKKVKCIKDDGFVKEGFKYSVLDETGEYYTICFGLRGTATYPKHFFIEVDSPEKEQYISVNTNTVYDVAFKGNKVSVLKSVKDGDETALLSEYLSDSNLFLPYTKEMAKQTKYNEDLGTLANVTSEIRKLLDNGHVICHAKANSDIEGLIEYTIMVGESK